MTDDERARVWEAIRHLADRLDLGEEVDFGAESELIRAAASDTGFSDDEVDGLIGGEAPQPAMLVRQIVERIRKGSKRLTAAIADALGLVTEGRVAEARALFEAILKDERVPLYRQLAAGELRRLERSQG